MGETYDVIVLGAGAWGSAAAQHIATRKRRVLCLDRFSPPHPFGSHHGQGRLINSNTESSANNLPLILRSYELWKQLERASKRQLLQRVGFLFVGLANSQRIATSLGGYRSGDVSHEALSRPEINRRFPQFRLGADEVAIFDPDAARLDPEACISAALEMAARSGAVLRFGEPALDWAVAGDKVEVFTTEGRYEADRLILAVGAWTPQLSKMHLPLWVERQVTVWYAYAGVDMVGFSFPAEPPATSLYGLPEPGSRIKVAFHHGGAQTDPDAVAPVNDRDLIAVQEVISRRVPILTDVLGAATCMYTNSPDSQYVVGPHPLSQRVTVLAGGSGRGFHQAQVIGEFAADCVEGRARSDLDWLSLNRLTSEPSH
jgi:sarcosine oxidase